MTFIYHALKATDHSINKTIYVITTYLLVRASERTREYRSNNCRSLNVDLAASAISLATRRRCTCAVTECKQAAGGSHVLRVRQAPWRIVPSSGVDRASGDVARAC